MLWQDWSSTITYFHDLIKGIVIIMMLPFWNSLLILSTQIANILFACQVRHQIIWKKGTALKRLFYSITFTYSKMLKYVPNLICRNGQFSILTGWGDRYSSLKKATLRVLSQSECNIPKIQYHKIRHYKLVKN